MLSQLTWDKLSQVVRDANALEHTLANLIWTKAQYPDTEAVTNVAREVEANFLALRRSILAVDIDV